MGHGRMGHGRRVYNERARVAYTVPCVIGMGAWMNEHYTLGLWPLAFGGFGSGLGQNSLVRLNLLTPDPLFLRLRIYYSPQVLN